MNGQPKHQVRVSVEIDGMDPIQFLVNPEKGADHKQVAKFFTSIAREVLLTIAEMDFEQGVAEGFTGREN